MGSRITGSEAEKVYEAAQKWIDSALRKDDSLFTPGKPIWSSRWLRELRERFLERPDVGQGNFYDKLEVQLEGSPPEVYQLMGEALYVHLLMVKVNGMSGETKKELIDRVLRWSSSAATIPMILSLVLHLVSPKCKLLEQIGIIRSDSSLSSSSSGKSGTGESINAYLRTHRLSNNL